MSAIQPQFSTSDAFYVGSALSTSAAMGVVFLKAARVTSFAVPFFACVIAAVALRALSEIAKYDFTPIAAYWDDEGTAVTGVQGVLPIINRGTDCFMNAVFQVVMHDDVLRDALYANAGDDEKGQPLRQKIDAYRQNKKISTYDLRSWMPEGSRWGQQDASDFLHHLVNKIDFKKCPKLFTQVKTHYFWEAKDDMGDVFRRKETVVTVPEFDITLEIPRDDNCISGQAQIQTYFSRRKHEGEKWLDDETETLYDPGEMQIEVEGDRLVFILKRFEQDSKICTAVDMPEEFELNGHTYELQKIITHQGTTRNFGHYIAHLRKGHQWVYASDTTITPVDTIDRKNGYIYFYIKKASVAAE